MSRFRRPRRSALYWVWFIALLVIARLFSGDWPSTGPPPLAEGMYEVRRVVDGDTLLLKSGARVRLQGIDTPEAVREDYPVEPWGPEASQFTERFIREAGGRVRLTFGNERIDRFDRYLAFAWHGDRMLNEELVRAGLARARLGYHYSLAIKRRLRNAEQDAKAARLGIWSESLAIP